MIIQWTKEEILDQLLGRHLWLLWQAFYDNIAYKKIKELKLRFLVHLCLKWFRFCYNNFPKKLIG